MTLRLEATGVPCACLVAIGESAAKVGQAKSCAAVETFTKVLEALALESRSFPSKLEKRSKRPTNELVSTCEI